MKHGGFIGIGLCTVLIAGCGKSSEKPAEQGQPTADTTAPKPGGGLAALFDKSAAPARSAKPSPIGGLFGGGINLGGGAGVAAAAEGDRPAGPVTPAAPMPAAKQAGAAAPGGDCGKAGAHVAAILSKEMGNDVTAEMATEMAAELSRMCTADSWPAAAVQCVLASNTLQGFDDCQSQLPYDSGDDLDEPGDLDEDSKMPDMDFGSVEPVPSGDAKCDAIGAHAFALLAADANAVPADQKAVMEGMKVYVTNMIAAECVKQQFSAAAKDCVLAAKTIAETEKCGI